jgi:Trk K+ transport system NAD-binding subunit
LSQAAPDSVILEPSVAAGSAVDGKLVRELRLGQGILLVGIRRGDAMRVPKGDSGIQAGDHIIMIAPSRSAADILALFRK